MLRRRVERRAPESGLTLIELLIAMAISVMIVGVVATSLLVALQTNKTVLQDTAESHDAQLVSAYLPADLVSAGTTAPDVDPAAATGCSGSPADRYNVARLTWTETTTGTETFVVSYRVRSTAGEWQLVRIACTAAAPTPQELVVARNLRPVVLDSDLPRLTPHGAELRLTITDASGYEYTVSGARRSVLAAASPTPTPSATTTPAPLKPVLEALELVGTASGDVSIRARFSLPIPAACLSRFTVGGLPATRGTYGGTATQGSAGDTATLAISRTTSQIPNTAVDGLTVTLTASDACDVTPFAGAAPLDKAAPVLLSLTTVNGPDNAARKLESNDRVVLQYSEPLGTQPAVKVELVGGPGVNNDRLGIPGLLDGTFSLGRSDYISVSNRTATASGSVSREGAVYTAVLTMDACSGSSCATEADIQQAAGEAPFSYRSSSAVQDAAGNSAASTGITPSTTNVTSFGAF